VTITGDASAYRAAEAALWDLAGVRPEEHVLRLPRLDVSVRVQVAGTGPTVLFLHGGPNSGSTWAPLVGHLPGVRSVVLDRPGTGLSGSLPQVLTLDRLPAYGPQLVSSVLDALDIERAHLVGSSLGGYLALTAAAALPDRVDRMVQMACPAFVPGFLTPPFMRVMGTRIGRFVMSKLPPTEGAGRAIFRQMGHGPSLDAGRVPQELFDWYLALQMHTDTMPNEVAMIASGARLRGFRNDADLDAATLAGITAPTGLFWGALDAFGGVAVAQQLAAMLPDARLEMVPDAGHLPWLDVPEQAAAFVLDHLGVRAVDEPAAGARPALPQ
jgi:pimeloyl-ACP methyl ester carboxylesterase